MPNANTRDATGFDARACDNISDNASALPFDLHDAETLHLALQQQLHSFVSAKQPDKTYIVADCEFRWNNTASDGYRAAEGASAPKRIRWPFDTIAAASWTVMRFKANETVEIEQPVVMSAQGADDTATERQMVEAFFAALAAEPNAVLISYGGETRDFAVLRRCAATYDLQMPPQLRESRLYHPAKLDLCMAMSVGAECVHLPELAAALSIPAKPSPSRSIGRMIEQGKWPAVREQVLADVLTTSVLAIYHLASHGVLTCNRADAVLALATAAKLAAPQDSFVTKTFVPWANGVKVRSRLRGVIDVAA
ncbi:hypothetical protein [Novosphingobium sp. AAP83]|uniref:hypothetical protein n=1 Tax=Novosphingobium sp. AAP83 TaxID=1523425 RepID=UPI000B127954|nr:hypothetical protein [Novosphingobium sp. AAP83]